MIVDAGYIDCPLMNSDDDTVKSNYPSIRSPIHERTTTCLTGVLANRQRYLRSIFRGVGVYLNLLHAITDFINVNSRDR